MDRESAVRTAFEVAWLLVLSLAGTFLVFDGSHDGSLVGGRLPSALLWAALWLGALAARTPAVVPVPVAAAVAAVGIPAILIAPSASLPVFVGIVLVLWIGLSVAHVAWARQQRTAAAR